MSTLTLPASAAGPDTDNPDSTDPGRHIRLGWILMAVIVGAFALWSALAPLAGAVIANGQVKVDTNRKVVQHQEGGIVKSVLVREGAQVTAGQVLVELADVQVDASLQLLKVRLDAERARGARLMAERELAAKITFPETLLARRKDPRVAEVMQREIALHRTKRDVLDAQIHWLQSQIRETRREIAVRESQVSAGKEAERLQRTEMAWNADLEKQGFISRARVLGMARDMSEYQSRRGEHEADLALARQRIADLELKIVSAKNEYMRQAADEWKESTSQL